MKLLYEFVDSEELSIFINSPNVGTVPSENCDSLQKGLSFGLHFGISFHLNTINVLPKVTSDLLIVRSIRSTVSLRVPRRLWHHIS